LKDILDLDRYPLDAPEGAAWSDLVHASKADLAQTGMFNLPGFIRPFARRSCIDTLAPVLEKDSFVHARRHNIYFRKDIEDLSPDHPALTEFETSNRTICADQMGNTPILQLYEWPPFAQFLAAVMGKAHLYTMADPLARVNVMSYAEGQTLNWHFDRSEFTTTLLLQAPSAGGEFEFARDLRNDTDPNYDGVAELLTGHRPTRAITLEPGTLNVFQGKNTAHRVTPIKGGKDRIIAVFSFFETEGVVFSQQERLGFYGRAG